MNHLTKKTSNNRKLYHRPAVFWQCAFGYRCWQLAGAAAAALYLVTVFPLLAAVQQGAGGVQDSRCVLQRYGRELTAWC